MSQDEAPGELPLKDKRGHNQSDKHRNCFKGDVGETSEGQGGVNIWTFQSA